MFRRRFFSAEVMGRDVGGGDWSDGLVEEDMSLEWCLFVDAWAELCVWLEAP